MQELIKLIGFPPVLLWNIQHALSYCCNNLCQFANYAFNHTLKLRTIVTTNLYLQLKNINKEKGHVEGDYEYLLILAHDLGTKKQSHERIINKYLWNGVNRNWNWYSFCIFNKQWMVTIPMSSNGLNPWRIWIPKETIRIQWVGLA